MSAEAAATEPRREHKRASYVSQALPTCLILARPCSTDGTKPTCRLLPRFVAERKRIVGDADRHRAAVLEPAEEDLVGQADRALPSAPSGCAAVRRRSGRSP